MALPVTISSTLFPPQNSYLGPFKSSEGAFYVVIIDSSSETSILVYKATDPTSSFSEQDSSNHQSFSNTIESVWVDQEGDVLHISSQLDLQTFVGQDGRVSHGVFDMASDSWGTKETIESPANAPTAVSNCGVSIAHRSDGDLITLYNGDTDKDMGTYYDRVDYAWHNGSSWSAGNTVVTDMTSFDAGTDMIGSVIVRGSSDRMHLCFKDHTNSDVYIRTLSGAATPALESMTFGSGAIDATAAPGVEHGWAKGHSYFDGTNHRVHCYYLDNTAVMSEVAFTSADTPSYGSPTTGVTNAIDVGSGNEGICTVCGDDDQTHLFYSLAGVRDLGHDTNDDEGGFGTDTTVIDVSVNSNYTSIDGISANIYDRDGVGAVIGILVDDNGTVKYTEASDGSNDNAVDINQSYSTLADTALPSIVTMGNARQGPFKIPGSSDAWYAFFTSENNTKVTALKATTTPSTASNWGSVDDPVHVWTGAADIPGGGSQGQRNGGPGSQDMIRSIWTAVHNRQFYVATQQESGRLALHIFDPASDTWTTRDETVALAGDTNFDRSSGAVGNVAIAVHSDGTIIIIGAYNTTSPDVFLRAFSKAPGASTWTNEGLACLGTSGDDYYTPSIVGPDSSDRISWHYKDDVGTPRTLTQSIAGGTISGTSQQDTTIDANIYMIGTGAQNHQDDRMYFPYMDADGSMSIYNSISGSTPSGGSVDTAVSDADVEDSEGGQMLVCVRDNGDIQALYVSISDSDIYRDEDTGSGYGTDTAETASVTALKLSGSILDNLLMWMYTNSGAYAYDSVTLTAETALSDLNGLSVLDTSAMRYAGPYYVNSALYIPSSRNGNDLVMMKSTTDPSTDSTFTQTGGKVIISNDDAYNKAIKGWHSWLDGDDIHILTMTNTGQVQYSVYQTDTDSWSIQAEIVFTPGDLGETQTWSANFDYSVSGALRADGDTVAVFAYNSGGFSRLRVYTRESGTWTDRGVADGSAASTDYVNAYAVGPDSSDRITWVYVNRNLVDVMLNSISSANSVAGETTVDSSAGSSSWSVGQPIIISNTIYAPYYDFATTLSVASWTSGASPTPSSATGVSDGSAQYCAMAARANGDRYIIFRLTSDADIYYDLDSGGGFGTDQTLISTITNAGVPGLSAYVNEPDAVDLDVFYYDSVSGEWHYGTFEIAAGGGFTFPIGTLHLLGVGI